jgi:hypothetical protein
MVPLLTDRDIDYNVAWALDEVGDPRHRYTHRCPERTKRAHTSVTAANARCCLTCDEVSRPSQRLSRMQPESSMARPLRSAPRPERRR